MDPRLLELLVCPLCKGPLQYQRPPHQEVPELQCSHDKLAFAIRDGIPIMLVGEARDMNAASDAAVGPESSSA